VGCDVVLELGLSNRSDRYYRAWLAPLVCMAAGGGGGASSAALPGSPVAVAAAAAFSPSRLGAGGGSVGAGGRAEGAESAVAVLEPGDEACLLAALARHGATTVAAGAAAAPPLAGGPSRNDLRSSAAGLAASGGGGGGVDGASALSLAATEAAVVGAAPLVPPYNSGGDSEWRRLVAGAASRVSSRLALCWEAITGDKAAERAQRGVLRLPAGLLARALLAAPQTPTAPTQPQPMPALATGALAMLVPPALRLAVELVGGASQGSAAPVALADITDDLKRLGVAAAAAASSAAATGQQPQQQQHAALARARAYGVRASLGDVLELRVAVAMLGQQEEGEEEVRLSVACRRLGAAGDDDSGVLLSGALQGARVRLSSSSRTGSHPFGAVCLSPGAYELTVRDVGLVNDGGCGAAAGGRLRARSGDASAMALSALSAAAPAAPRAGSDPARSEVYAGVRPLLLVVV
jgi:hypothetical protein